MHSSTLMNKKKTANQTTVKVLIIVRYDIVIGIKIVILNQSEEPEFRELVTKHVRIILGCMPFIVNGNKEKATSQC